MNKKLLSVLFVAFLICTLTLVACTPSGGFFNVTLDYNYEGAPTAKVLSISSMASLQLETPARDGYTFEGWYTDADCTTPFDKATAKNQACTLYAKWAEEEPAHTCITEGEWAKDTDNHWLVCTCNLKVELAPHAYGNDDTCDVCGYVKIQQHEHEWSTEWSKDEINHWYECSGCDELSQLAGHTVVEGVCTVCGYEEGTDPLPTTITVYYYNYHGWDNVSAYVWNDLGDNAWPGQAMTATENANWYSIELATGYTQIIFNNGLAEGAAQTADLTLDVNMYFYRDTAYATLEEAQQAIENDVPYVAPVAYFYNHANWSEVYGYSWGGAGGIAWPGSKLTETENANWYAYEIAEGTAGFLFHNNLGGTSNQTPDLTVSENMYFYKNVGYATLEDAQAKIAEDQVNPVVPVYTLRGDFNTWGSTTVMEANPDNASEVQLLGLALEAGCEFKVVITIDSVDEWINVLKDGVTAASMSTKNDNMVVNKAGTYNFYFDTAAKQLWVEEVVVEHVHEWEKEWSTDYDSHWYNCAGCEEVSQKGVHEYGDDNICDICSYEQEVGHEHNYNGVDYDENGHWFKCSCGSTTEVEDHEYGDDDVCDVCEYERPHVASTTVYFYNYHGWAAVNAYAWNDVTNVTNAEWPGVAMQATDVENWYSLLLVGEFNKIIFNNGASQTDDLDLGANMYFYNGTFYATLEEAQLAIENDTPYVPTYVYFYNHSSWAKVNLYTWNANGASNAGWPGVAMQATEDTNWFKAELLEGHTNVIFNDNAGNQTADLTVDVNLYYYNGTFYATLEDAQAKIAEDQVNPTGPVYTLAGDFNSWNTTANVMEANPDNANEVMLLGLALEAGCKFKVVINVDGVQEWINALKDGVTVADQPTGDMDIVIKKAGTYNFYFDTAAKQLWVEEVVVEHVHESAPTISSDATHHWYACTGCDELLDKAEHEYGEDNVCDVCEYVQEEQHEHEFVLPNFDETGHWNECACGEKDGFADHEYGDDDVCDVCEYVRPVVVKTVIYFYNNAGWTTVNAYTWDASGVSNAGWPGVAMQATEHENWYSYEVETGHVNVIFNNKVGDDGTQTGDLVIGESLYFYKEVAYATMEDANAKIAEDNANPVVIAYTLRGDFNSWGSTTAMQANPDNANEVMLLGLALEAGSEFKVVIDNNGQVEWINSLKDGVTAATMSTTTDNITVGKAGTYNFYFDITSKQLWVEEVVAPHEHSFSICKGNEEGHWGECECGEKDVVINSHNYEEGDVCADCGYERGHVHAWSEVWANDETHHWHECEGCDEIQGKEEHANVDGSCLACGYVFPVKVVVYFYNSANWATVNAYTWVDGGTNNAWPGVAMQATEHDKWFSHEVETGHEKIIFNDGSSQTGNLVLGENLYYYNGTFYATMEDAEAKIAEDNAQPEPENVLYLKPNSNWTQAGARFAAYFFNNSTGKNTWVSMTDSNGDGFYEVEIPEGTWPNVIFVRMNPGTTANNWNNKWNQTGDLKLPTNGNNLFTVPNGAWDGGSTADWSTK